MHSCANAYNDEASIYDAVRDFLSRPDVRRVIVVSNNSSDRTMERAREAGAIVYNEALQGYGACVFRCLKEALAHDDTGLVVVCEGDRTFRASDLDGSQWKPCLWATFDCNGCDWLYFCRGPPRRCFLPSRGLTALSANGIELQHS